MQHMLHKFHSPCSILAVLNFCGASPDQGVKRQFPFYPILYVCNIYVYIFNISRAFVLSFAQFQMPEAVTDDLPR